MTMALCCLQGKHCSLFRHSWLRSSNSCAVKAGRQLEFPMWKAMASYCNEVEMFISKHICIKGNVCWNYQENILLKLNICVVLVTQTLIPALRKQSQEDL